MKTNNAILTINPVKEEFYNTIIDYFKPGKLYELSNKNYKKYALISADDIICDYDYNICQEYVFFEAEKNDENHLGFCLEFGTTLMYLEENLFLYDKIIIALSSRYSLYDDSGATKENFSNLFLEMK